LKKNSPLWSKSYNLENVQKKVVLHEFHTPTKFTQITTLQL